MLLNGSTMIWSTIALASAAMRSNSDCLLLLLLLDDVEDVLKAGMDGNRPLLRVSASHDFFSSTDGSSPAAAGTRTVEGGGGVGADTVVAVGGCSGTPYLEYISTELHIRK